MMAFPTDHSTKIPKAKRAAFQLGSTSFPFAHWPPQVFVLPTFRKLRSFSNNSTNANVLSLAHFVILSNEEPTPHPFHAVSGAVFCCGFCECASFFFVSFPSVPCGSPRQMAASRIHFWSRCFGGPVRCGVGSAKHARVCRSGVLRIGVHKLYDVRPGPVVRPHAPLPALCYTCPGASGCIRMWSGVQQRQFALETC